MRLNLSSEIVLNKVPVEFYKPKTTVEYSEISRMEKIHTDIFASMAEGASHVADGIEAGIKAAQQEGKFYVMALGTGSSLTPVYEELIRRYEEKKLSFRNVVVFNSYEYYPLQKESSIRCINQLKERFLDHVDISEQNIFSLDGFVAQNAVQDCCRLYEQRIKTFGGLDVALLGIGRMGNIAANEPGSGIQSVTRLILIGNTSREEMENSGKTKESVPPCSLTMGIATLLSAKAIYLTAWGEEKSEIMQKVVENGITDTLPASFLQTHPNAHVVLDLSAAAHLTRIEHPWLVTSCQWTDKLVRSALVWLCQKIHKPILKLTNKDYNENGLSELLALYGSAYNANIKIFNDLQHTITGWPGGKPNADDTYRPERAKPFPKKVIVFSPHPDDDVISMGGTIRRLVQQQHEVHVAYETSGNIAVGDEEVTRFMHFINGFNQIFADSKDSVISKKYKEIAAKQGLILVDTKYEFGKRDGKVYLIDEIHTPDSSRYFYADGYEEKFEKGEPQRQLSKEFVRQWLIEHNFMNEPGQTMPEITDEYAESVSDRYIELYEHITGEKFDKAAEEGDIAARIEKNVSEWLATRK